MGKEIKDNRQLLAEQNRRLIGFAGGDVAVNSKTQSSKILKYKEGADGKVYGIIQEGNEYFLKYAKKPKDSSPLELKDFYYLGGLNNRLLECHKSYSVADRRLGEKLVLLRENYEELQEEIPLNADLEKTKPAPQGQPTPPTAAPAPAPAATPEAPSTETPAPAGSTDGVPEQPAAAEPESPEGSTPPPVDGADQGSEQPSTDGDTGEEGKDNDPNGDIEVLLGKLSQKLSKLGDAQDPSLAKSALNTIISSTKQGLEKMDDQEKESIIKRIEKNGQKIEEDDQPDTNGYVQAGDTIGVALNEQALRDLSSIITEVIVEKRREQKTQLLREYVSKLTKEEQEKWMSKAFEKSKKGTLHKKLGIKEGEKIPEAKIDAEIAKLNKKYKDGEKMSDEDRKFKRELELAKTAKNLHENYADDDSQSGDTTSDGSDWITEEEEFDAISKVTPEFIKANPDKYHAMVNSYLAKTKAKSSNAANSALKPHEMLREEDPAAETVTPEVNNLQQGIALAKQLVAGAGATPTEPSAPIAETVIEREAKVTEFGSILTEGVLSNLNTTAKVFLIAGFLSVLGGKVSAAVDQYQKATGERPDKETVMKAVQTLKGGGSDATVGTTPTPEDGEEKVTVKKQITPYKRVVDKITDKDSETFHAPERGPNIRNQAVTQKPDAQLDDHKDTERLEKNWRSITKPLEASNDPEQTIKDLQAKYPDLKIRVTPEGKVVFDFKYLDADTKDEHGQSLQGKTITKLAGNITKSPSQSAVEKEQDWVKLGKGIEVNFNKLQGDKYKAYSALLKQHPERFKSQGNNFYIYNDAGKWIDSDKVGEFLKVNPQYAFGDPAAAQAKTPLAVR